MEIIVLKGFSKEIRWGNPAWCTVVVSICKSHCIHCKVIYIEMSMRILRQGNPQQQRIIWPKMSIALGIKNIHLEDTNIKVYWEKREEVPGLRILNIKLRFLFSNIFYRVCGQKNVRKICIAKVWQIHWIINIPESSRNYNTHLCILYSMMFIMPQ